MVRVIIEHKAKDPEVVIDVIRELRNEAMRKPGYITGETLVNTDDPSNILVISTWQTLEDWIAWDRSDLRNRITQRAIPSLTEPYTVRTFQYQVFKANRVWSTF